MKKRFHYYENQKVQAPVSTNSTTKNEIAKNETNVYTYAVSMGTRVSTVNDFFFKQDCFLPVMREITSISPSEKRSYKIIPWHF